MATIVPSDQAPAEAVHFTFGTAEFDLGGRTKTYKTDDPEVISNASAHPWLTVQVEEVPIIQGAYVEQIAPKDDPFTLEGGINANDPKLAQAAEEAKAEERGDTLVAIDAGKTQTDAVTTGGQGNAPDVAETVAADPDSKTAEKVS
jgi:hypothetical protein